MANSGAMLLILVIDDSEFGGKRSFFYTNFSPWERTRIAWERLGSLVLPWCHFCLGNKPKMVARGLLQGFLVSFKPSGAFQANYHAWFDPENPLNNFYTGCFGLFLAKKAQKRCRKGLVTLCYSSYA